MEGEKIKSLSDIVSDAFYENCCKNRICSNCKYDTPNFECHILRIVKLIQNYEKENIIYEENNKNQ